MKVTLDDVKVMEEQSLSKETVDFSKRSLLRGARDCNFKDCELVLDPKGMPAAPYSHARFSFLRCTFERCTFVAKGPVRGLDMNREVKLLGCTFKGGPYIETKFGPDYLELRHLTSEEPTVLACDFREADLHDVRFYRTSPSDIALPRWPHISVVARDGDVLYTPPSARRPAYTTLVDQVEDHEWPSDAMRRSVFSVVAFVGVRENEATVQTVHAEDITKNRDFSTEALRAALEEFGHPAIRF